ncbi:hypothetical protein GWK47_027166 [Chionoecetes opilio]|uniref:Uncharacterized protein n=1 Tax=Chionoecetes opilio TaxID=41210 RepID=A0A8J8WDV2_CHIOP|nr:hypothetical protein GWK47_027166 [Chionoecetes opilio]
MTLADLLQGLRQARLEDSVVLFFSPGGGRLEGAAGPGQPFTAVFCNGRRLGDGAAQHLKDGTARQDTVRKRRTAPAWQTTVLGSTRAVRRRPREPQSRVKESLGGEPEEGNTCAGNKNSPACVQEQQDTEGEDRPVSEDECEAEDEYSTHLALLDKVQGRAVRLIRDSRAGTTTSQPSAPPRRSGPHRDVQGASAAGASPAHTPAAPPAGPDYHKGRCSSPRRATTAPLPYLAPPASVRLRLRRLVEWSSCLAATPWRYNCARVQGTCERVAAEVITASVIAREKVKQNAQQLYLQYNIKQRETGLIAYIIFLNYLRSTLNYSSGLGQVCKIYGYSSTLFHEDRARWGQYQMRHVVISMCPAIPPESQTNCHSYCPYRVNTGEMNTKKIEIKTIQLITSSSLTIQDQALSESREESGYITTRV